MAAAFLPRSPSPNSAVPNPGPRSQVTHFIPIGSDASSSRSTHERDLSASSAGTTSLAMSGRRAIAHSPRVLGIGQEVEEALALEQLKNGEVDVSFPAPEEYGELAYTPRKKGKARASHVFDAGEDVDFPDADEMADVDLEQGASLRPPASSSRANLMTGLGIRTHEYEEPSRYDFDAGGGRGKSSYFREYGQDGGGFGAPEGFERIMPRESAWMWLSVALTAALCLVATLISTDVIDWPGDGIGKQ